MNNRNDRNKIFLRTCRLNLR